ncbi:carbohydrate ABC transporter permease [Ruania alba]|uniref:Carbohydrate ABC transporter membrane protein 1, CUT1 family n=1 Tax=Ruania alba TaxID=648782 RepID=A0A1H5FYN9_9MICO|nr:sugar ABC transporter permease [Ruania alba]SEE08517.1 carbohydrate ABC transporter membrane protein 1, CUT1 family [Ruania alba]
MTTPDAGPAAIAAPPRGSEGRGGRWRRVRRDWWIYLFLLPTIVGYGLYTVYPLVASWWYSFLDWPGFALRGTFIGLANYERLVADSLFWNAFVNSFIFLLIGVPLRVGLGLLLAYLLNKKTIKFRTGFRTLFFLPVVTTGAIIGMVYTLVLDATGPVNLFLTGVGIFDRPVDFLGNPSTSLYAGIGVWVWKWVGITMIYWLAALQTIPEELYEAARLDGANAWQEFRHITIPMLVPFLIIITLIDAVAAFNVFDLMLTMTGGGPTFSSEVIEIFIYRTAFEATVPQLGYASAAAVLFGLTTAVIAVLQAVGARAARRKLAS